MSYTLKIFLRKSIYVTLGALDTLLGLKNNLVIYCYHNIHSNRWVFNVNKNLFKEQLDYLLTWGQPVSMSDIELFLKGEKQLPKKAFALTFDDGYQGIKAVEPYLTDKHISPSVYLLPTERDLVRYEVETSSPLLTPSEIKELIKKGWEFGSHGLTHRKLTRIKPKEAEREVFRSKFLLENKLKGETMNYFAYPHGQHSLTIQELVKKAGFNLGLTMDDERLTQKTNFYRVPRVGVMGNHSLEEFKYLASPSVLLFRKLIKKTPLRDTI